MSRALAGYSDVSPATRDRVVAEAQRVGYVPSRVGRMLVSGRTNVVAMTLPVGDGRMIGAFLGEFVAGLGEGLAERGLDLIIAAVPASRADVEVLTYLIQGSRADAVVINRTHIEDARVRFLPDRQFPFIAHGRVPAEERPHPWFDSDGEGAFREAAETLVGLGHRRFALLTIDQPLTFARLREDGLRRGLTDAGLTLDPDAVVTCRLGDEGSVAAAAQRILQLKPRPSAVLGVVDTLAIAVLAAAAEAGIAVPDDLSVVGFDDIPVAAYASPPLTTFDQGARRNGSSYRRSSGGLRVQRVVDKQTLPDTADDHRHFLLHHLRGRHPLTWKGGYRAMLSPDTVSLTIVFFGAALMAGAAGRRYTTENHGAAASFSWPARPAWPSSLSGSCQDEPLQLSRGVLRLAASIINVGRTGSHWVTACL